MKIFKRVLIGIVAVIVLIVATVLGVSVGFNLESVEFSGEVKPVSYKELVAYVNDEKNAEKPLMEFDGCQAFNFHFSNGFDIENEDSYVLFDKALLSYVVTTVDAKACIKAYKEGATTVPVRADVLHLKPNGDFDFETFTLETEIVEEIVSELRFADTLPDRDFKNEDIPEVYFMGKKFEITYSDGTEKTAFVTVDDEGARLDAEKITAVYDEYSRIVDKGEKKYYSGIVVKFLDETVIVNEKEHPFKYKDFEVVDYSFSHEGLLQSITYRLTYKDGKVKEKECTINQLSWIGAAVSEYMVIDTVDGYDVLVHLDNSETDGNNRPSLEVAFGHEDWKLSHIEYVDLPDKNKQE